MNCKNCGMMINQGENMCRNCGMVVDSGMQQMNYQNYQQPMGQPVPPMGGYNPNMQGYNTQPQKSNGGVIIAVVAIIAVLVIGVTVFLVKGNSGDSSDEKSSTSTVAVATTKVKVGNYTFDVPSNYTYEISSGKLLVSDDENWILQIAIIDSSYSKIKANKHKFEGMKESGFTMKNVNVKTYGGVEFINYELLSSNMNFVGGYAKTEDNKVAAVAAINKNYTIDFSLLEKAAPIIKSAKYNSSSHSINPNQNFDISSKIIEKINTNSVTTNTTAQQQPLS